jgi:hypothetical protein
VVRKPALPIVSDMPDLEKFNHKPRRDADAAIKAQAPGSSSQLTASS